MTYEWQIYDDEGTYLVFVEDGIEDLTTRITVCKDRNILRVRGRNTADFASLTEAMLTYERAHACHAQD